MPKATALSREECLIAALEQRVVIGDMLNGKLKAVVSGACCAVVFIAFNIA